MESSCAVMLDAYYKKTNAQNQSTVVSCKFQNWFYFSLSFIRPSEEK